MNKTGIPYLDRVWNPCGFGCSKGCIGCWARRMAPRMAGHCPDCAAFRVHFHPERLSKLTPRQKPQTIGVQFTGELFDSERPVSEILQVLVAMARNYQHTYVMLTQQPVVLREAMAVWTTCNGLPIPDNWWLGLTIRNPVDAALRLDSFLSIPQGKLWLSIEPLYSGPIPLPWESDPRMLRVAGVVIGHDNTRLPCDPDLTELRALIAAIPRRVCVYVKQLWWVKPHVDVLCRDPRDFPVDLRRRELPWPLREGATAKGKP